MATPLQEAVVQGFFDLCIFLCGGGLLVLAAWFRRTGRSLFGSTPRPLLNLIVWSIISWTYGAGLLRSPELLLAGGPGMTTVRWANLGILASILALLAVAAWRGRVVEDGAAPGEAEPTSTG